MNQNLKESMIAGDRNIPLQHRRGLVLNGVSKEDDLDLFSNRSDLTSISDDSDAKQGKSGRDDLLSSTDVGKHDYDWLLTPPGTPLVPSSDGNESQSTPVAPRSSPSIRSVSAIKASRLSVSQSESSHPTRPTRSSSATRPSVSSSQYSINSNKSNSILNTSSASVSSYIRPSTPTRRSSSITRASTPSSHPKLTRSSTPSKARPTLNKSSTEKTRLPQNSRSSTPTSRQQISANLNPTAGRSTSRPSTPTRRSPAPSLSPVTGSSASGGHTLRSHKPASVSHQSSPGPPVRPRPQPIVPPDFPLETPPNLRTTLPDRALSAGRSRPGAALTLKANVETRSSSTLPRRQSSPMVARGRVTEPTGRARTPINRQLSDAIDSQREISTQKPVKTSAESTGFGRNISKKSMDVAIKNLDIKHAANGIRSLAGSNLFPQSIRSANQKSQPRHLLSAATSVNRSLPFRKNGAIAGNENHINRSSENENEEDKSSTKVSSNVDIYESSRYDMILLKEDLKNTNWLHSHEDRSDGGPVFDNELETLPEPFSPL